MFNQIDSLFKAYDRADSPGCAAGVVLRNKLAYAKGYGMANLEQKVEITPNTAFDIGSEGKQFTAACILLLAQRGKISLQDDIRQWFPELPDYGATITVQHLIHHTSGIPEYYDELESNGLIDNPLSRQEYLDFIFSQVPSRLPAGGKGKLLQFRICTASGVGAASRRDTFRPIRQEVHI